MFIFLSSSRGNSVGEALELLNNDEVKLHRLFSFTKEAKERAEVMKMFLGEVIPYHGEEREKQIDHRLLSKAFEKSQFPPQVIKEMKDHLGCIMVDSGAFSVWTKGKTVDIQEYIEWIKLNIDFADYFVSLDVIPGTPTKPAISQVEKEESAKKSLLNYHKMVRAGIPSEKLIHVLHYGDDVKWADRCRDFPFIGMGGMVGQDPAGRLIWMDNISRKLIDKQGMPVNKWHCFGVTDKDILLTIPFYSCDSAGWLKAAVMGTIHLWMDEQFQVLNVLHNAKNKNKHVNDLPPAVRKKVVDKIESMGFTLDDISMSDANGRIGFNILTWKEYEQFIDDKRPYPWPMEKQTKTTLF